jgi:hypothetical protein
MAPLLPLALPVPPLRTLPLALASLLLVGRASPAQVVAVLPAHEPLNPAVVARSGLYLQAIEAPAPNWRLAVSAEYGSVVERNLRWPDAYLYDAELLRVQLTARRDVGRRGFVRLQAGATGAYDGFADALFERYHQLIRWVMPERDTRPRNEYAARLLLTRHQVNRRGEGHALLPTDVRATVGVRLGAWQQSSLAVTLPTAPGASPFARRVPTVSVLHSARAGGERLAVEASAGLGYSPTQGELAAVQRTLFPMVAGGVRLGIARHHSVYGALFHHGAAYRGTGFPELDRAEYSVDFGYVWAPSEGRRWRLGLTEDVRRRDPGVDLVLKVSVE